MPNIEIPQDLYDRFAKRAAEKGYASVEAYLAWALRQMADKIGDRLETPTQRYTAEQEATVRDRLRSLGYID